MIWLLMTAGTTFLVTGVIVASISKIFVAVLTPRYQVFSYLVSGALSLVALYMTNQWFYDYFDWAPVGGSLNFFVGFLVVAASTAPIHAWLYGKFSEQQTTQMKTGGAND